MSEAPAAIPLKPNTAAMIAMMKKAKAHLNTEYLQGKQGAGREPASS